MQMLGLLRLRKPLGLQVRQLSTSLALQREVFVRERRNINLVTLGASQHGKTLLCSRLTSVLGQAGVPVKTVQDIDHMASEREAGMSQSATHLQLWTSPSSLVYSVADLPGDEKYIKNCLAFLPHACLALLVVHTDLGVEPHTRNLALMARHLGVPLLPVLNQPSPDPETLELVEMELEEVEGLGQAHTLVDMVGSDQAVLGLVEHLEERCGGLGASVERQEEGPVYMALEQVGNIPNRGTFCAGRILRGTLKIGDQVEAFYQGKTAKGTVKDMEIYRAGTGEIQAGDRAGVFLKLKPDIELKRGGVLYDPKTKPQASASWSVLLRSLPGAEPLSAKGEAVVYLSIQCDGKVAFGSIELGEGEELTTGLQFSQKVVAHPGEKFVMRVGKTFLLGEIIAPLK